MSCQWKKCNPCKDGMCLWARGMKRLLMSSNLEPQFHERLEIKCTPAIEKLLKEMRQIVESRTNIVIEASDRSVATILAIKCLQNYFNLIAEEAGIDGLGVYVPVIEWIKKGLNSGKSINDREDYIRIQQLINDSRLIVWDVCGNLTDWQREELNNNYYGAWTKGKSQIISLPKDWRIKFADTAIIGLLRKARLIQL